MSKKGIVNLFIQLVLIFSVTLNSFSAAKNYSIKKELQKEVKKGSPEDSKEELKAASLFDVVIPFAGIALEKDLYIISSFDYNPEFSEAYSEEDHFRENKFFKALFSFFIAKKGP